LVKSSLHTIVAEKTNRQRPHRQPAFEMRRAKLCYAKIEVSMKSWVAWLLDLCEFAPPSYEGMKSLIETMLLVAALLLSISFSGMQNLDHDDLISADARNHAFNRDPRYWKESTEGSFADGRCANITVESCFARTGNLAAVTNNIPSYRFMTFNMSAMQTLFYVMVIGVLLYASLVHSKACSDIEVSNTWYWIYSSGIISGYALLLQGLFYLLEVNQHFTAMIFPLYSKNISSIYDPEQKTMVEGGWYLLQEEYFMKRMFLQIGIYVIIGIFFLLFILFHCVIAKRNYKISASEEAKSMVLQLMSDLPKEFQARYARTFVKEQLSPAQIKFMKPKDLRALGIPYGHVLKILEGAQKCEGIQKRLPTLVHNEIHQGP
jgi:hypothetical protein